MFATTVGNALPRGPNPQSEPQFAKVLRTAMRTQQSGYKEPTPALLHSCSYVMQRFLQKACDARLALGTF